MKIFFANTRVKEFVESLVGDIRIRVDDDLMRLAEINRDLGMPLSKPIGRGLFELRVVGLQQIRFLYTFNEGAIYLLHGFLKKTNKIPNKDLEYARRELKDLR